MSKNDQFSEGCTRCSDYDKVKDDLENLKEKSKQEQREALKSCEQGRELLQKKLLKVGAVAVIGGTILGKEFVEKIASYIESFNKVADVISYNTPTFTAPVSSPSDGEQVAQNDENDKEDDKKDDKKEDNDKEQLASTFFPPSSLGLPSSSIPFDYLGYGEPPSLMDMVLTDAIANLNPAQTEFTTTQDISDMLQMFALPNEYFTLDYPAFDMFDPYYDDFGVNDTQQAMIVPDAGTGVPLIFAGVMVSMRRRRNT